MGFLPVPRAPSKLPAVDVSLFIRHTFASAVGVAAVGVMLVLLYRSLHRRGGRLLRRMAECLAILGRPPDFVRGVVAWQALGRLIRLGSLASLMAAFARR